jgi:hypothetical protein
VLPDDDDMRVLSDTEINKLLARMTFEERDAAEAKAAAHGAEGGRRGLSEAYTSMVDVTQLHEFKLFEKMDREREAARRAAWREQGNAGEPPPMLLPESELPQWATAEEVAKVMPEKNEQQQLLERYGRGQRERGDVQYFDNFSELEWAKLVDSGKDLDDIARMARERKALGIGPADDDDDDDNDNAAVGAQVGQDDDEDHEPDDDDDLAVTPLRGKRKSMSKTSAASTSSTTMAATTTAAASTGTPTKRRRD